MIKYSLNNSYIHATVSSDINEWINVDITRSKPLGDKDWSKAPISKISVKGYGDLSHEQVLEYAQLLKTAYAVAAILDSEVFVFKVTYTPKDFDHTVDIELAANTIDQLSQYLNSEGITKIKYWNIAELGKHNHTKK
jgi:hypothetical protein